MDSTRSKLKDLFLYKFCIIIFFFFAIFINTPQLFSSEHGIEFKGSNLSSMKNADIIAEIDIYLSNHSLYPFLMEDSMKYDIYDIQENSHSNTIHTLGILQQEENSLLTLFSVRKGWFWNETELVYMTNDTPISPTLFTDISFLAANLLPPTLSNYHVFIEKLENSFDDRTFQHWLFFNEYESVSLMVILKNDNQGGFYFTVMEWPE